MTQQYEAIIGLEIHIRLDTKSKMFCGSTNAESAEPNMYTCPICMGHPGTLPALNAEAVELGTKVALALNCDIPLFTKFDRKNYFYPDLPKGYQISQYDQPIAVDGFVDIYPDEINPKKIRIERLHLEEDAAKLKHDASGNSLVDFNRAGAPLAELVTKPDIRSAAEAKMFMQEFQQIVRYIGASHADMEKGHMRCDANVSLRPVGESALYPKTEVKNMNSFRSVERAILYEIERQTTLWDAHNAPEITTTRGWDDSTGVTVEQRTKEDASDYRYFPEPDIPPLVRTQEEIELLRRRLPELPMQRRLRFMDEFALSYNDAKTLTTDPAVATFFEDTMSELRAWLNSLDTTTGSDEEIWTQSRKKMGRLTASWVTSEIFKLCNAEKVAFADLKITPENMAELLTLVYEKRVNSSAAQKILHIMFQNGGDPSVIMQEHDLTQVSDHGAIDEIVQGIINSNASVVAEYKAGKEKALMYLVGQVMKASKGKVNPEIATELLTQKLSQ
jgi:aspartyl-tRNA(Asn)/glutamyl-tRNA(Gln) amidotransferase subunit B